MEKLTRIFIGNESFPIKMDLNVLEAIQDQYGTVSEWEREILGLRYRFDENGKMILTEEGTPSMAKGEPSVKAIKFVLPIMIREGQEIEYEQTGKQYDPVTEDYVNRWVQISYRVLANIIHDEFAKCFRTKK